MLITNLNTEIKDLQGAPLKNGDVNLTLKAALVQSLSFEPPVDPRTGQQGSNGEDRFKRWTIANKVQQAGDSVELTVEEVALAKAKVGEAFLMVVVGPVWTMIESAKKEGEVQ